MMFTTRGFGRGGRVLSVLSLLGALAGCGTGDDAQTVDFDSEAVAKARMLACHADFEDPARMGAAATPENAGAMWPVSPYSLLLPASGVGHIGVHVDAEHFDWLVYTDADSVETESGPRVAFGGPLAHCADKGLKEWGAHHAERSIWGLKVTGEPGSRVRVYVALSATDESDWSEAGHAGHVLGEGAGDGMQDHAGHGE